MGRIPESEEEAIALSRSELHPETLTPYPPITPSTPGAASTTQPPPRRSTRRPCPHKTRPVVHKLRRKTFNSSQWSHLLSSNGIYFPVPQVIAGEVVLMRLCRRGDGYAIVTARLCSCDCAGEVVVMRLCRRGCARAIVTVR